MPQPQTLVNLGSLLLLLDLASSAGAQASRNTVVVYKGGINTGAKEASFVSAVKNASHDLYNILDLDLQELSASFPTAPFDELEDDLRLLEITSGEVSDGKLRTEVAIFGLDRKVLFRVKYSKDNQDFVIATQALMMLRSLGKALEVHLDSPRLTKQERDSAVDLSKEVKSEGLNHAKIVYGELGKHFRKSRFKGLRKVACHFVPPRTDKSAVALADDELSKLIIICAAQSG